ncbi:MAG: hypothetical protein PHV06_10505, partial [bacterium]|nr:hypothetical protein [bacterium]
DLKDSEFSSNLPSSSITTTFSFEFNTLSKASEQKPSNTEISTYKSEFFSFSPIFMIVLVIRS